MQMDKKHTESGYYDMTEDASKRPGGEKATEAARKAENDDVNEETGLGTILGSKDHGTDDKIATSLDDE